MKKDLYKYLEYLIAILIIICLNFLLPRLLPSDPVNAIIGDQNFFEISDEAINEIRIEYGLDKPLYIQFLKYFKNIFTFNFGYSYYHNVKVMDLIVMYAPWTIVLTLVGFTVSLIIAYLLGVESGFNHGKKIDKFLLSTMMMISGFPAFFIGMFLLIIFSVKLGILPMGGCEIMFSDLNGIYRIQNILKHMILPIITVAATTVPNLYLLMRNSAIPIIEKPYINTGRAKGLKKATIKHKYVGKNSFLPLLVMGGIIIGKMLGGIIVIEVVFSYPGVGSLIYDSVRVRDYPVLQASFFFLAIIVLFFNLLAETISSKYRKRRYE